MFNISVQLNFKSNLSTNSIWLQKNPFLESKIVLKKKKIPMNKLKLVKVYVYILPIICDKHFMLSIQKKV